jgi:hypothetical protein
LVGNFNQDDTDQEIPDTGVAPPTITLNGDDQITIECGTPFTDPGATAVACSIVRAGSVSRGAGTTTTGVASARSPLERGASEIAL